MRRRGPSCRPCGFTLPELVVVLAIVAVLSALMLPAIQQSRDAARRSRCSSNLRQLVLGAHYYASAYSGVLPGTASTRWTGAGGVLQGGWQWHAPLLAHVEQGDLYNSINWSFSAYDRRVNVTAVHARVNVFVCPADRGGRSSYAVSAGTWYDYDYAVTGRGRWDGFARHPQTAGKRVLAAPNLDAAPDGTSNTVMFAEQVHSPSLSELGPAASQMLLDPGMELRMLSPDEARNVCLRKGRDPSKHGYVHPKLKILQQGAIGAIAPYPAIGEFWAVPYPNRGTFVNGLLPPNSPNFLGRHLGSPHGRDGAFGLRPASSWHLGGVNLGYADGSVRFATDDMDVKEYTGRFSLDRGEVIVDWACTRTGCF